jgi:hypothetical protein
MKEPSTPTDAITNDGSPVPVTPDELLEFKHDLEEIVHDAAMEVHTRRTTSEDTRFCRWEGQSPDGLRWKDRLDGRPAFPFEGAFDARVRLADEIVTEKVLVLMASAMRAIPQVRGMEAKDQEFGKRLQLVLKWVLKNKLGMEWWRELTKVAQYQEGDSPAAAVLGVFWCRETGLKYRTITLANVAEFMVKDLKLGLEEVEQFVYAIQDPSLEESAARALVEMIPLVKPKRARRVVRDLRENKQTQLPVPYLRKNQPKVRAFRLYENIFFRRNITDIQTADIYVPEWLTAVQLRDRKFAYDYDEEFIEEVLEHEGETAFDLEGTYRALVPGDASVAAGEDPEPYRGKYEVITRYYWATNEDDIPGLYQVTFSAFAEVAATPRQLLDYPHGKSPFIWFSRETLSDRLLDSRGWPELLMTDQRFDKIFHDTIGAHAMLSVPPLKRPRRRGQTKIVIRPLAEIQEDRPGEIEWMQPPQYPVVVDKMMETTERRVARFAGRMHETVPAMISRLHMDMSAFFFLSTLKEALFQMVSLCQAYLDEPQLQRITGANGKPVAQSREQIEGEFDLELDFSASELDIEWLVQIAEFLGKYVLPMDSLAVIQRDQLVAWLVKSVLPNLADLIVSDSGGAQQSEIKDEEMNFVKINAGIEPEMMADGQNFPLRLAVLENILKKNPESGQVMKPKSQEMLAARHKHLANQVQQLKNAQIGRQVGQPALEQ